MADLRCSEILHLKAYGDVIEVRCFRCGRLQSTDSDRLAVYHSWRLVDGQWKTLADRVESLTGTRKSSGSGRQLVVK